MSFSWWWLRWKDCCSTGRYLRWKHCPTWRYLLLPPNNIWWPVCLFLAQPGSQRIRFKRLQFNSNISTFIFSRSIFDLSLWAGKRENTFFLQGSFSILLIYHIAFWRIPLPILAVRVLETLLSMYSTIGPKSGKRRQSLRQKSSVSYTRWDVLQ